MSAYRPGHPAALRRGQRPWDPHRARTRPTRLPLVSRRSASPARVPHRPKADGAGRFSFGPSTARFLFGKTKRKWGVDSSDKVGTTQPADWLPLQGIEFNKNTVQCIESGNRFVTDLELKAIAQVLGVTADELLSE